MILQKTFRCAVEKFMEMPKALRLSLVMVPVVLLFLLLALLTPFFGGCLFSYGQVYREGSLVVEAVGDKDGIVTLKINDGSPVIDTRASVYQRFSVIIVAPDQLLFLSSDIGDSQYRKLADEKWTREPLMTDVPSNRDFAVMVTADRFALPDQAVFVIDRKKNKLCYRNDAMRFAFPVNHRAKFAEWTVKDGRTVAVTILSNPPQTVNLY